MKIRILVIGHLKESYWKAAESEYLKRLLPYAEVYIEEVDDLPAPQNASSKEETMIKEKEGEKVLSKIKPSDFVCTLDLKQKEPTSEEFSMELLKMLERGGSSLTFVIGGSLGLGENIKKRANASMSISKLTFTHQMTRVILLEQIYRGFRIARHEPYHK
ncbi:MAG: 23S rRNA (pseudouridine(1915)-N(3))-methyltransferase RlmH [Bacilli bacterium]|nr:23S rRNA (pseudouridine(1915)-N(3))-methyltransferase RlmH [Bacilli bacterium]